MLEALENKTTHSIGMSSHVTSSPRMHAFNLLVGAPLTLIINYSLFQYLSVTYYTRWRQWRVKSLICSAFLGFAVLIPSASSDEKFVDSMNDVSEICSVLTFLVQVTIIGHDVLRRVKVSTLRYLTYFAEALVFLSWMVVIFNFVELSLADGHAISFLIELDNILECLSLAFVVFFRFYYLSLGKNGWVQMAKGRKLEIFLYVLFMTHEYPFMILNKVTGDNWEFVQALYMRLTMALCLILTVRDKIRGRSRFGQTSVRSGGPSSVHLSSGLTYAKVAAISAANNPTAIVPSKQAKEP